MDYTCTKRSLDNMNAGPSRLGIQPRQAVSIAATRGTLVRCERGTLWLTQEGHYQDYILVPGTQYLSPEKRTIVVSAFDDAGAVTVSWLKPGSERGFGGSLLQIDPAVIARLGQEARQAQARLIGDWIGKLFGIVLKALRGSPARTARG